MLSPPAPRLNIADTLRIITRVWWHEFASVTLLGFLLVLLPDVVLALAFGPAAGGIGGGDDGTIVWTVLGVCLMLYGAAVAFGIVVGLRDGQLRPGAFVTAGLAAAKPGLLTALVLGTAALLVSVPFALDDRIGSHGLLPMVSLALLLFGTAALLPAVPAAVAERLAPIDALKRAAELTRGHRSRLAGLLLVLALGLLPPIGLIQLVMFGPHATPDSAFKLQENWTFVEPRLWIGFLSDLLFAGLAACVPPVVYSELVRLRQAGR
ncbi:MAG: hypothetical protein RQ833_05440 [Sphingomonadaceae bacterium]|nr:hypothetical protein [Sphingomonadaceae bacterium]